MPPKRRFRLSRPAFVLLLASTLATALAACRGDGTLEPGAPGGDDEATGPAFTVSPLPVEALLRISPIGSNNKIFPVRHTYWDVCDLKFPEGCPSEKSTLLAPGPGIVMNVDPAEDGRLQVIGHGDYAWGFGHVTPLVKVNDTVEAGQPVAIMHYIHGFDFEVMHKTDTVTTGIANPARLSRVPVPIHPVSLYPDSLRTRLIRLVTHYEGNDTLGRAYWDAPGTAMGAWFIADAPDTVELFNPANARYTLFLARFTLRPSTRFAAVGGPWPDMQSPWLAIDPQAPDWEEITPASGTVAIKVWVPTQDELLNPEAPRGTLLVKMTAADTLLLDWFPTHEVPAGFSDSARVYVR